MDLYAEDPEVIGRDVKAFLIWQERVHPNVGGNAMQAWLEASRLARERAPKPKSPKDLIQEWKNEAQK